jgi:hypothetical protein
MLQLPYYLVKPVQEKGDEPQRKAVGLCHHNLMVIVCCGP